MAKLAASTAVVCPTIAIQRTVTRVRNRTQSPRA